MFRYPLLKMSGNGLHILCMKSHNMQTTDKKLLQILKKKKKNMLFKKIKYARY